MSQDSSNGFYSPNSSNSENNTASVSQRNVIPQHPNSRLSPSRSNEERSANSHSFAPQEPSQLKSALRKGTIYILQTLWANVFSTHLLIFIYLFFFLFVEGILTFSVYYALSFFYFLFRTSTPAKPSAGTSSQSEF